MNKEFSQRTYLTCAINRSLFLRNCLTALLWMLVIAITFILINTGSAHAEKSNVTLNGYTFSDDSANLWENKYFSSYYKEGEPCLYYGSWIYLAYGDFRGGDYIAEFFDRIDTYKDITCVVYREHGFWQGKWEPASGDDPTAPDYIPGYYIGELYTRYNYLAKDMDGNIHILKSVRPNDTDLDDAGLIIEGGTTLMYPNAPALAQPVYSGYVESIDTPNENYSLAPYDHCISIVRWMNYGWIQPTIKPILLFLKPGIGIVEMAYYWSDLQDFRGEATGINGYLMDASKNTYGSKPNYTPENVVIHGYTFDESSATIWENQYFGNYTATTITEYTKVLYGYGDFKSYDIGIYFDSFSTANNVPCTVLREHGYTPKGTTTTDAATGKSVTTFTFSPYTRYDYLAKDLNGNIHLLKTISGSNELDADGITANGGTTLLYPNEPVLNQLVYDGTVQGINNTVDVFTGCLSIRRGVSPSIIYNYYKLDSGIVTSIYNWGSTVNGFSANKNPTIKNLPSVGGTDSGTGSTETDDSDSSGAGDDSKVKNWYECFIETANCDNTSASQGLTVMLFIITIISLRMATGVVRNNFK
jgi:hypothetical protein